MWIYEYEKLDGSAFLPPGRYHTQEDAADAMKDYAERFGEMVQGPKEIEPCDIPAQLCH
jgi:predicted NUDIX family NTP pyrophosphohydrolase